MPVSQQAALDAEADATEEVDGDDPGVEDGELRSGCTRCASAGAPVVERRKAQALTAHGRLACEVCGLDLAAAYGPRGRGFIEVHHLTALFERARGQRTRAGDLALLCCNSHRMAHRQRPWRRWPRSAGSERGPRPPRSGELWPRALAGAANGRWIAVARAEATGGPEPRPSRALNAR